MLNFRKIAVWLVCVSPALALLWMIAHFSVNVPVTDQYAMVNIFQHLDEHKIVFSDFWAQHNEHRVLFPTIILTILALISRWNILVEIYASFVIACVGFYAIVQLIRRHVPNNKIQYTTIFLISGFYFSPVQSENWLWGWQLEWFLCIACILWVINILDKLKKDVPIRSLLSPGVIAFVATFSLGSGSLAWVAGLVILAVKRMRRNAIAAWAFATVLSLCLYYFNYHKPENGLSPTSFAHNIPSYIKYYIAYTGRPIADNAQTAVPLGACLLALFVGFVLLAIYKKQYKLISIASMGLVALIAGLFTNAARFDFGIINALSSRYTAFSMLLVISIVVMLAALACTVPEKKLNSNIVIALMLLVIAPPLVFSWNIGLRGMRERSDLYSYIYKCSREKEPTYNCLYEIYFPSVKIAKDRLDYLKQKNYGGY